MLASMRVLGLTGGIACGKSTVSRALAQRGVPIVDADRVAREVVAPGTDGLAEVVAEFGTGVLAPDGSLDRGRLGHAVFGDEIRRRRLNSILHPRIAAESARKIASWSTTHRWVVYDAALLVENESHRTFAGLIVVTSSPRAQRERLVARDGLAAPEADARIASQLPLARKIAVASHVVDNSGTLERLRRRVDGLYAELVVSYGPPWRGDRRPDAAGDAK